MEERPTLQSIFSMEQKMLFFTGMYSYKDDKVRPVKVFLRGTTVVFSILMCGFMIWQMYLDIHEPQKVFETMYFFFTQIGCALKLGLFAYHMSDLHELERRLEEPVFTSHKPSQDHLIATVRREHIFAARGLNVFALTACTFFVVQPLMDDKILAVPAYFGVDPKKYQLILNIYESICFFMNAYNNLTVDCMTAALINVASAQLDILKDTLQNHVDHEDDAVVEQNLKKCVVYHNATLNFIKRIEEIFTYGIFFQMLSGVLTICMTAIQFLLIPKKSLTFLTMCFYFPTMIYQVGIYEWFGQEILSKSSEIVQACYLSNWITFSNKNKKTLFIIMERSKRPVLLTAGYFVTLSLATYMSILRTAYSYFAVIRQMYQKENEV